MKPNRRSGLAFVGLVLIMLLLGALACSLSGGDDDDDTTDSETTPTLIPTDTPSTAVAIGETTLTQPPTLIPTWTPYSNVVVQYPSATPGDWSGAPTAAPQATLAPLQTLRPYDIRITFPGEGNRIANIVSITGSASHPSFLQYALEWSPANNPAWYPLTNPPQTDFVLNRILGFWDTKTVADGIYDLRLHVWLQDGSEIFYPDAAGLQVEITNATGVAPVVPDVPTEPNQKPTIDTIPNQLVNEGQTLPVTVSARDADGDNIQLFVASSNSSVATAEVAPGSAQQLINITGHSAGEARIIVTVRDERDAIETTVFTVTVEGTNRAPLVNSIAPVDLLVNQFSWVTVNAVDPDGDRLQVRAELVSYSPAAFVPGQAILSVSVPDQFQNQVLLRGIASGTATVRVTVEDGQGGSTSTLFTVSIGSQNRNPEIDPIPAQWLEVREPIDPSQFLAVPFSARDPDLDTLTAVASSNNLGVVTAYVSGTSIILTPRSEGVATVTLSVRDGRNGFASKSFSVTVGRENRPPSIGNIPAQSLNVGDAPVDIVFTYSDLDNDDLQALSVPDDAGVVDAFVTTMGTTQGTLRLTPRNAGQTTVRVLINDGRGGSAVEEFVVTVIQPNRAPVIVDIPDQTITEGNEVPVRVTAYDPDGDRPDGDATSSNTAVVEAEADSPNAQIILRARQVGTATVTVTIRDPQGATDTTSFIVRVVQANQPPEIQPIDNVELETGESDTVSYVARDPEGTILTVNVASEDENIVRAWVSGPNTIQLVAQDVVATTQVIVRISDGELHAEARFNVRVVQANRPPVVQPIAPIEMEENTATEVTFSATDPDGDNLSGWAVESNNPAVVVATKGEQNKINLEARQVGDAIITLSVPDGQDTTVVTFPIAVVPPPNLPPVIDPIADVTLDNQPTLEVSFSATDPDGDELSYVVYSNNLDVVQANVLPDTDPDQQRILLTAAGQGTTTVTLEANDGTNDPVIETFNVEVTINTAPEIVDIPSAITLEEGEDQSLSFLATDPDGDDLTITATSSNPDVVTAQMPDDVTIVLSAGSVDSPVAAAITITVSDESNDPVSGQFQVEVIPTNEPPVIEFPDLTGPVMIDYDGQAEVRFVPDDEDVLSLILTVQSSNTSIVTAELVSDRVRLQATGEGETTVIVSADDGFNPPVEAQFTVQVGPPPPNNPPRLAPIDNVTLTLGDPPQTVGISVEDDEDDSILIQPESDNLSVVRATISAPNTITLTPEGVGQTTVTVTASDGVNDPVSVTFTVEVVAPAPPPPPA
ncbi:MAG: hypothetical protein GYB65_20980, partial [Chloroflexi bacterium]|nr:hypothetical protein [Chloroflexota bacterium]